MQLVSKVESEAKVFPVSRASVTADFIPNLMAACEITFTRRSGPGGWESLRVASGGSGPSG